MALAEGAPIDSQTGQIPASPGRVSRRQAAKRDLEKHATKRRPTRVVEEKPPETIIKLKSDHTPYSKTVAVVKVCARASLSLCACFSWSRAPRVGRDAT